MSEIKKKNSVDHQIKSRNKLSHSTAKNSIDTDYKSNVFDSTKGSVSKVAPINYNIPGM